MVFVDCGEAGGERFVDVVLCSVDPLEYGITLEQARAGYGLRPLYSAHEWALRF